eukprot:3870442-Pyramimonas_sp.AAC.2
MVDFQRGLEPALDDLRKDFVAVQRRDVKGAESPDIWGPCSLRPFLKNIFGDRVAPDYLPADFFWHGKRLAAARVVARLCVRSTDCPLRAKWLQRANQWPVRGPSPPRRALSALVRFLSQVSSDLVASGSFCELAGGCPFEYTQELRRQLDDTLTRGHSENEWLKQINDERRVTTDPPAEFTLFPAT